MQFLCYIKPYYSVLCLKFVTYYITTPSIPQSQRKTQNSNFYNQLLNLLPLLFFVAQQSQQYFQSPFRQD